MYTNLLFIIEQLVRLEYSPFDLTKVGGNGLDKVGSKSQLKGELVMIVIMITMMTLRSMMPNLRILVSCITEEGHGDF